MKSTESEKLFKRAQKSIAGGVNSHFRALVKPTPLFYDRGKGSKIYDADGNQYIDYALAQGPMVLGHCNPAVLKAVKASLSQGQLFAGQHLAEIELAELFQKHVPCADLTRFSLTGSEADQTALRVARAYTGRLKYIKFEGHYHGWFDNVLVSVAPGAEEDGPESAPHPAGMTCGQAPSALDEIIVLPWNNLEVFKKTVRKREREIAGVIMEPIMCNSGCILPGEGFLEGVRKLCTQKDIPLIFDEIITGFRASLGGAQEYLKVTPDLATFGKAMAAGYPISAITGKRKFMDLIGNGTAMHAGTFNSYNHGVAASIAAIHELKRNRREALRRMARLGKELIQGFRAIARQQKKPVLVQGPGPMFHVGFTERKAVTNYREYRDAYDRERYARLVARMAEGGVRLIGRGICYVSAAHTDRDIQRTLHVFETALKEV